MKKTIVILANCQGSPLKYMLDKYYSTIYNVKMYSNYEYIKNNLDLPLDIKDADIFLYQNYSNNDEKYDLKNILENKLKKECIKICFPSLHSCNLIFCYDTFSPNNYKTITKEKPFGNFFFGISSILEEIKNYDYNSCNKNEIIERSNNDNFISEETILYYNKRTFEFLENKCLSSHVPEIYNFIKINFTKYRLWHNPNHPTGILLNELIKLIFLKLGLEYFENEGNMNILNNCLSDWVMPIFPCVTKYYKFEFDTYKCSSWYNKNIVDSTTYMNEYIEHLYSID
jgi:hypothetical protein